MSYVLLALAVANGCLILWLLRAVTAQAGGTGGLTARLDGRFDGVDRSAEALRRQLADMDRDLRGEIASGVTSGLAAAFDKVQQGTAAQAEQLGRFGRELGEGLQGVRQTMAAQQELLRDKVEGKLEEIRSGNQAKLEEMRRAVDEQLQSALEKRLEASFQQVTEQFAQVQQAIGQVQSVASQIGDLKRLFSNVKMRGGVGEGHLRAVLDDFLPAGAYEPNLRIAETGEVVEFAVRIPAKGERGERWLAIDAKFPTEDYERLLLASEANDRDQETVARKALERRIREEAKRIAGKYIRPPYTLEFAIMYLPSEGLDSEVARMPGLIDALRRQYAVHVMGPRLLPAHLHCIRVGYLTLALEQKAGAIGEILAAVKAEWSKLGASLEVLARRAETLNKGIRDTQQRTRIVGRTLTTVDALDFERAEAVLGLSEEALLIAADGEGDADMNDEIPVIAPSLTAANRGSPRAA